VIEPIFDRTFIFDSYACRQGKGTHAAVGRYREFARKNRYVLKCDIRRYFQSIDHQILRDILARKIRCKHTLWLVDEIVSSKVDNSMVHYFSADDLFTPFSRKRALPIGNLTSQFFANLYLDGFDHFVKEHLRCRFYIRYVDDFVVLDNSKERLRGIKKEMERYLDGLRLRLHRNKCRVYRVADGVTFLGYRIFPTHCMLKKANVLRIRRRLRGFQVQYAAGQIDLAKIRQSVQSWIGHASHADTYRLRRRLLGGAVFQRGEARGAPWRFVEQQP
jgi:retron-type reverse transcriptase